MLSGTVGFVVNELCHHQSSTLLQVESQCSIFVLLSKTIFTICMNYLLALKNAPFFELILSPLLRLHVILHETEDNWC